METPEQILQRVQAHFPSARVSLVPNPGPAAQHSLLSSPDDLFRVAQFLRDDEALALDYCSNATGVDWPERKVEETVKVAEPDPSGGPDKLVEKKTTTIQPAYLEAVYHLFSMAKGHGPVVLRSRTANRTDKVTLPSLTPLWRSCEFQEREIFDLFGITFEGHPDLRRLLMWDEFKDHPMRKDYVEPDDYEWEPTPHGSVLAKASRHYAPTPAGESPSKEPKP